MLSVRLAYSFPQCIDVQYQIILVCVIRYPCRLTRARAAIYKIYPLSESIKPLMLCVVAFEVYQLDVIGIECYARIVDIIVVQRYDVMPDYIMLAQYRLTASRTPDKSVSIRPL